MSQSITRTLDQDEIAKFEALAKTWWDPKGPMRPLHQINPLRLDFIMEEICDTLQKNDQNSKTFDKISIVDIGCAGGLVAEPLAQRGAKVTGLDPAPENINVAKLHAENAGLLIDYRNETLEQTLAQKQHFDVVLALEVIEHVADVPAFVAACCQAVSPGGLLVMSTLNRTLRSFALAIVGAEYVLQWLPRKTHDWERFIRPDELERLLKENGFRFKSIEGIVFSPLRGVWQRSADTSVNYQICAIRDI